MCKYTVLFGYQRTGSAYLMMLANRYANRPTKYLKEPFSCYGQDEAPHSYQEMEQLLERQWGEDVECKVFDFFAQPTRPLQELQYFIDDPKYNIGVIERKDLWNCILSHAVHNFNYRVRIGELQQVPTILEPSSFTFFYKAKTGFIKMLKQLLSNRQYQQFYYEELEQQRDEYSKLIGCEGFTPCILKMNKHDYGDVFENKHELWELYQELHGESK